MSISRRDLLLAGAAAGVSGLALPAIFVRNALATADARFTNPLELPPLLEGRPEAGIQVYDLNLQRGHRNFFSDLATPTAGINGSFLGPVVKVNRGDRIRLNVTNRLSESSTLHWHGMHLPAKMDGGPHQVIEPGSTWSPEFEVRQPAATQWYHSHMLHRTGVQVYYGLAGLLYIDDEESSSLGLPSEYGVDDIPLVLLDRAFNRDGTFSYLDSMHDRMVGMTGNVMLVNGVAGASLKAQRRRLRLRILNGSNARIYNLEFSDQREFQQIATDGGLLSRPVALRTVRLAPGERAEIVVELSPGDDLMLRHTPPSSRRSEGGGMMGMMGGMMRTDTQPFSILRIDGSEMAPAAGVVQEKLISVRDWSEDEAARTRRFVLDMGMGMGMMGGGGGFTINGKSMELKRIDETIRLGDVEIWEISNRSPMPHPFHIHDIQFRILDRDGRKPPANEQGLKDTVLVESGETVRIITQFEHYADADSPYMFHCHILEHEDAGMMGQFVVVA